MGFRDTDRIGSGYQESGIGFFAVHFQEMLDEAVIARQNEYIENLCSNTSAP